jgi:hypothetical protein
VFKRIKNNAHVYAPIGIPHNYEVVVNVPKANGDADREFDSDFRIDTLPTGATESSDFFESQEDAEARVVLERTAIWPRVYLRAVLYFLTLVATAVFVVFPFTGRTDDQLPPDQGKLAWVADLIQTLSGFLPSWASFWLTAYAHYPAVFVVLVVILAMLLWSSSKVAASITDRMEALWKGALAHRLPAPEVHPTNDLTAREKVFSGIRSAWRDYLGPALSAIAIVYVVLTVPSHWLFTAVDDAGFVCKATDTAKEFPAQGVLFSFNANEPCFATGYRVGRLDRYYIWTTPDKAELDSQKSTAGYVHVDNCTAGSEPLANGSVVTDAKGYGTFRTERGTGLSVGQIIWNALLLPLKRHYSQPWFQPVARYRSVGSQYDFLEPDPDPKFKKISEFVSPKVPGELFFYVNDAVTPIPGWQYFYGDNHGCMSFFVKPPVEEKE